MKGQLNLEFVISVGLFMIIISYAMLTIFDIIPSYHRESEKTKATIRADIIADMLIFDQGSPLNWNANNVERIGLSNGVYYYLSNNKITQLRVLCDSYDIVRELLGADVNIKITNMETNGVELDCKPSVASYRYEKQVTRFAILGNDRLQLDISLLV